MIITRTTLFDLLLMSNLFINLAKISFKMWSFITDGQLLFHGLSTRRPYPLQRARKSFSSKFRSNFHQAKKPNCATYVGKNDFRIEQSSVNKTTAEIKSSEAVSK